MNSDLMPSPESSNSNTSIDEVQTNKVVTSNDLHPQSDDTSEVENAPVTPGKTETNSNDTNADSNADNSITGNRLHPIPPPSEPMQYRAIGLIRGRYLASSEQFTQGSLLTTDGVLLDAVLLGRIMSLVKNHLDLDQEHLWVVYPRTRQENDNLHMQIVGVWEPERLAKASQLQQTPPTDSSVKSQAQTNVPTPASEIEDGGFSVRGEIVYQSADTQSLVVKIKQAPRKPSDKPKYFKLKVKGVMDTKAVGKFWDLQLQREGSELVLEHAEAIADLPKKRKPPFKKPFKGSKKPFKKRYGDNQRPYKRTGPSKPIPKGVTEKPIKRPKPPQE
ncbi:MAG: hypothetical protein QNJ47_26860 [Nostocaceae cyanobacterium]|nr:hypothetical protein [Nostocaceae cyanobacterium]